MLKKLILKNFQIHEKLVIDFDSLFTLICGHNDSGKSSIVRALYWLFYNEPVGDWMCRINDEGSLCVCSVKAIFDDDTIIERIKGDGINKYIVDGEEYENFGYTIPQQVLKCLKIYPFITNKQEFKTHIAMQDEKAFLIHESAPVKASILDSLTGASSVQKAITSFNKESLATVRKITECDDKIAEIESELKSIPDLESAEKVLKEARKIVEKVDTQREQISRFLFLRQKYESCKQRLDKVHLPEIDINLVQKENNSIEKKREIIEKLIRFKNCLISAKKLVVPMYDITVIDNLCKRGLVVERHLQKLLGMVAKLQASISLRKRVIKELGELEEKYKEFKVCPICGSKLND